MEQFVNAEQDSRHQPRPRSRAARRSRALASREQRLLFFAAAAAAPGYLAWHDGGLDLAVQEEVGVVIWFAIALGIAFGILPRSRRPPVTNLALAALGLLVALAALSLLWTTSVERTYGELTRVVGYAGILALVWLAVSSSTWRLVAAALTAVALGVCALAIASRLFPAAFPDPIDHRLAYPLGYWNALGSWAAISIALGLGWSLGASRPLTRAVALACVPVAGLAVYLAYSRGSTVAALVAATAVVALARDRRRAAISAGVALTGTGLTILVARSQPEIADATGGSGGTLVLAALVVTGLACAAIAVRPPSPRRGQEVPPARFALVAATLLVVAGALAAAPRVVSPGGESVQPADYAGEGADPGIYPGEGSDPASRLVNLDDLRPRVWSQALDAYASSPATGIGAGTFGLWWIRERDGGEAGDPPLRDAHSLYLETLAELGPLGLLAIVGLLAGLLLAALRALAAIERQSHAAIAAGLIGALVAYAAQAGVDWLWEVPAVTTLALGAGAVAGVAGATPRSRRPRLTRSRGAFVALAIVAAAIQVPALASTGFVRDSATFLARGDLPAASERADAAVAAEPWSATARAQRALVEERLGERADALADARKAVSLDPDDWKHHYLLARLELADGDEAAAVASLRESARLQAVSPDVVGSEALAELREDARRRAPN
jgi:O-antigen ligase/polysaccharide polymerase Wzy-like membrane protein